MKKRCFLIPEQFGLRMFIMVIGMVIQGLGWSLLMKVNLGIDPYGTCVTGLSNILPVSFGTVHLLIQFILMLFVIKIDISLISFGTIGNMFILGYITDFFSWTYSHILPPEFFMDKSIQYIFFIPGLILLLLGAALYISSGLGVGSYDAIPTIVDRHFPKISYRIIRLIWDCSYMLIGVVLGSKIGIVTIGIAIFAGTVISAVQVRIEKFIVFFERRKKNGKELNITQIFHFMKEENVSPEAKSISNFPERLQQKEWFF